MGLMWFDIPFTIWRRGQSAPDDANIKIPRGNYQVVFDNVATNPLGTVTRKDINQSYSISGYGGVVKYAQYNPSAKTVVVNFSINDVPAGNVIQIPVSLIVIAILGIVGGVVGIALLSKFQRVISLPIIPIILAVIVVWKFAPYLKKAKQLSKAA